MDQASDELSDENFLGGQLLIAMPGIGDPRFEHAVILMCIHSPEHSMGLAVNRPLDGLQVPDLLERLGVACEIRVPDQAVLSGGPVERERGFVIHTDDYATPESTLSVAEGLALTATRDVLEAMGSATRAPRQSLLALGCAGWSPGQLEKEIKENVWLTCEPDLGLIFDQDHESKWARALAKLGITPAMLSSEAGHA
jgi:putative transcriptional regulator